MNVLIKRNPIGVVVGLITAAASSLVFFRDRTEQSAEAQRKLNEQLKIEQELLQSKVYDDFLKKIQDEIGLSRTVFEDGIIKDGIITDQEVLERFKKDLESFNESELIQFGRFFKDEIVALQREAEQHPEGLLKDVILGKEEHFREMLGLTTSELIKIAEMRDSLSGNVESTIITNGDGGDVPIGLPDAHIVSDRMQEIEDEIALKTQELQQFYVEGRISTEAQLEQDILDMKLKTYQEEMNLLNMSSVAHNQVTEKFLELKTKEKIATEKANNAQVESNKKLQKQEAEKIQNVILHAQTAEEALANLLSMKINEILLEAMASLWKDGSIPFLAKVGLAVGMKALVTPLINNLLNGGGGQTSVVGSESGEMQFEKGGLTRGGMFQGASHANGGVKFRVGGTIHEAEGGEAIINKRSTARFRPILSAINSYNGNGVKFADGGIISQGEKYAMGGELRSVQSMVSGSTTQKVVLVESDVTNTQNRISALESQSSF